MATSWRQLLVGKRGVVPPETVDIGKPDGPARRIWIAGLILAHFDNPLLGQTSIRLYGISAGQPQMSISNDASDVQRPPLNGAVRAIISRVST